MTETPPAASVGQVTRRLARNEPVAFGLAVGQWIVFHMSPLLAGAILKFVLDRLTTGAEAPWMLLAALLGAEVGRWSLLIVSAWQFQGAWLGWVTTPRVNALTSLATGRGAESGRLPGSSGEAVSRFRDDTHDLAMVLDSWIDISGALISTAVALVVMYSIDSRVATVVLIPLAIAVVVAMQLGPRLRRWRRLSRRATSGVTSYIGDTFAGILTVKTAAAEDQVLDRFRGLNDERASLSRRDQMGRQVLNSIGSGTGEITTGIVLFVVAQTFRSGALSVGDVALFASYVSVASRAPRWIGRVAAWYQQAEVSVERLGELVGNDPMAPVRPVAMHLRHGPPPLSRRHDPPPSFRSLEVRGLTATHGDSGRGVVDVNLEVRAGQVVVVTGEVGVGKTTLLRAILGVVPIQSGRILWNGDEVGDPATELIPPRVAYLPQVPRLFSEPLADTIRLGIDGDLERALWLACMEDDVAEMDAGTDTIIGPRGLRLSGGQIQRTAAARAFIRRPQLLVIDDLSSALDVETEIRLWERLAQDDSRTVLMVSHRDHVLASADQVIVLGDGRRIT